MLLSELEIEDYKKISSKAELYWIESDVFYVKLFKDSYIDLDDIKEIVAFQLDQNVGVDHKRLIHAEKFATISREAREFLQKTTPTVKAEAYVIPSLSQKILFNLYIKFRRNSNPIKGFDSKENALAWLGKFE